MIVILAEEPSMKVFLETLIGRVYPGLRVKIIPHRGKQDLEKSIPKVLRAWREPNTTFIVVHDQDSWDCVRLKTMLTSRCDAVRPGVIVRIVCHELEAWYWGDLTAVEAAFEKKNVRLLTRQKKYREPDSIVNAKTELKKHLPKFEQQSGAKAIAMNAEVDRNTSPSFQVFWRSLSQIAETAGLNKRPCKW